jgi:phenylpropionate dioxygenase-like ring-hydroxylating dioxygenase large terminal subunit
MMVPRPGDFFTKEIEVLKSSILVTRDSDRRVRVFHNVCPHRGNKLAWETHADREIAGHCKRFVCKFHGISFTPDGKLAVLTDRKSCSTARETPQPPKCRSRSGTGSSS